MVPIATMPPIIIGDAADVHVAAVTNAVRALGLEPIVFSASTLEGSKYCLDSFGLELGAERLLISGPRRRGWIRRLAPPGWRRSVTLESHDGTVRSAVLALLTGLIRVLPVDWLSPLDELLAADNKLVQWRACVRLGIPIPRTVLASARDDIPRELGSQLVVKPLGAGAYRAENGEQRVVFATGLAPDDTSLDVLSGAPFLVQERIEARRHLRVVTVGDERWVYESSATASLDWRCDSGAHASFEHTSAWGAVGNMAVGLAADLGVGFSSQDWIVGDERSFFVDLNPGGQWLFLEQDTKHATDAIARWLSSSG